MLHRSNEGGAVMLKDLMRQIETNKYLEPPERADLHAKAQLASHALRQAGALDEERRSMVRQLAAQAAQAVHECETTLATKVLSEIVRVAAGAEWRRYAGYSAQPLIQYTVWMLEAPNEMLAEAFLRYEFFHASDKRLAQEVGEELHADGGDVDFQVVEVE